MKLIIKIITAAMLTQPATAATLPRCTTEDDSRDCVWDAQRQGNGQGTSFIHYKGKVYVAK